MGKSDGNDMAAAVCTARILKALEEHARRCYDGHLTIMRFTTGWKVQLGTPDLLGGSGYAHVQALHGCGQLDAAMAAALAAAGGQLPYGVGDVMNEHTSESRVYGDAVGHADLRNGEIAQIHWLSHDRDARYLHTGHSWDDRPWEDGPPTQPVPNGKQGGACR